MPITSYLRTITEERGTLSTEDAAYLMRRILAGEASEIELAALLGAIAARGEAASELAGFALAMREAATTLPLSETEREELVDTCGTGGDASGTFNISTAAALVAAAAGAKVAKHGNRAVTSRCGSADVLEALGIPVTLAPAEAAEALRRHNFCFLLAPSHHPAMRLLMPVRRALGVRTLFNVLGPLLNPAGARRQVLGVYAERLVPLVAEAMTLLNVRHAFVVHGVVQCAVVNEASARNGVAQGMDEFSLSGPSVVAEVHAASQSAPPRLYSLEPEELGLQRVPISRLAGGDAGQNAALLRKVFGLDGEAAVPGPHRDVVVLNAAAVLVAAGMASNFADGIAMAAHTIRSGRVAALVKALRQS